MSVPALAEATRVRDWRESGLVDLTGHADGPGIVPPGHAATWARSLAALVDPGRLDGSHLLAERAELLGASRAGRTSLGGGSRLLRAADGWVAVSAARPDDPMLLAALIGRDLDEIATDIVGAVEDWAVCRPAAAIQERAVLLGLALSKVPDGSVVTKASTRPLGDAMPTTTWAHADLLGARRSVSDLLVVDFSALWAGPLAAHLLGRGGARVVKVETPSRPDGARRGDPRFYDLLHGGHESVCLDPSDPGQRTALHELVRRADVVIEASRPRALAAWGLDVRAEVDRGATWVSITAAGRASDRIGFGDDIAAGAGLVARDEDGDPVFVGDAVADPLTGIAAAALVSSSAAPGRLLDLSMHDLVAATLVGPALPTAQDGAAVRQAATLEPRSVAARADPLIRLVGPAPLSGADTAAVLRDLGVRWPR